MAEDKIEIPVEIRLKDIKALKQAKKDADDIDKKLSKAEIRKRTFTGTGTPLAALGGDVNFAVGEMKKPTPITGALAKQLAPSTKSNLTVPNQFKIVKSRVEELERQGTKIKDISNLTKSQLGNITSFAQNPFTFIIGNVMSKFSRGTGILVFVPIIFAAVQFILEQLTLPGRPFDRRFKRVIQSEILLFQERLEKAEKRQGFREVRITTISRLRGGRDQVSGNFFDLSVGTSRIPYTFRKPQEVVNPNSSGIRRDKKGSPVYPNRWMK